MNDVRHFLVQFRSETDPREEYISVTAKDRERWHELALPGFVVTAAVSLGYVVEGHLAYFIEPTEHRYWMRDDWERGGLVAPAR